MYPIYKEELRPGLGGVPGTVLTVHEQNGVPHVWFLSDGGWTDLEVVPTGASPNYTRYIGSAHNVEGWMVFHVFAP